MTTSADIGAFVKSRRASISWGAGKPDRLAACRSARCAILSLWLAAAERRDYRRFDLDLRRHPGSAARSRGDCGRRACNGGFGLVVGVHDGAPVAKKRPERRTCKRTDRKSTRLNSSHLVI